MDGICTLIIVHFSWKPVQQINIDLLNFSVLCCQDGSLSKTVIRIDYNIACKSQKVCQWSGSLKLGTYYLSATCDFSGLSSSLYEHSLFRDYFPCILFVSKLSSLQFGVYILHFYLLSPLHLELASPLFLLSAVTFTTKNR